MYLVLVIVLRMCDIFSFSTAMCNSLIFSHDSIFEIKCNTMFTGVATHCQLYCRKKLRCAEINFMFESKFHFLFEMNKLKSFHFMTRSKLNTHPESKLYAPI